MRYANENKIEISGMPQGGFMRLSATEALKEFPFLSRVGTGEIRNVYVQKMDRHLLERPAQGAYVLGYDYCVEFLDIFVLDAEGKKLAQVGPRRIWNYLAFLYLDWFLSGETVGDVFARLHRKGKLREAAFVLVCERNYGEIALFKPPEGRSVENWYDIELQKMALDKRYA